MILLLFAVGILVNLGVGLPVIDKSTATDEHADLQDLKFRLSQMQSQLDFVMTELEEMRHEADDDDNSTSPAVTDTTPSPAGPDTTPNGPIIDISVSTEVGFSAKLSHELYDLPTFSVIKYDFVIFNAGNAYDRNTGIFTVPVEGMYMFTYFVESIGTKAAEIQLVVDGNIRFPAISDPENQGNDDTGGNMVIEHLVKGQQVWIETYETENQNIFPGFTTFHGALITAT